MAGAGNCLRRMVKTGKVDGVGCGVEKDQVKELVSRNGRLLLKAQEPASSPKTHFFHSE